MPISTDQIADTFVQERLSLTSLAWALVRDHHLAEDAVQEALVSAIRKSDSFESVDHIRNWLRQAVRQRAIDLYRKRGRQPAVFDAELIAQLVETWEELEPPNSSDMIESLQHCLGSLPPRAAELIRMRYEDNSDLKQIANEFGYKIESVYCTMSRIRKALWDCMSRRMGRQA